MRAARRILQPVLAVIGGLALGLLFVKFAGESPWHVLNILARSAFGSRYDIGMTLFYATPLIFTGLAVAASLQCGLFNIGAEGQLTMGALAAAAVGICFPNVPHWLAPWLAGIAAFTAGAVFGGIPGWLRAWRGSHEVINTIMLNFVAAGLASYVTLYLIKNPETQNPESLAVGASYLIPRLPGFGDAPVSVALLVAILIAIGMAFVFRKTVLGYGMRAVGASESAARAGGIDPRRIYFYSMAIGGGLAGLVALPEVLGNAGRFRLGFSPDYGFIGIAVALLGRGDPLGIVVAAVLFGALHKGAGDLDMETENVTRDLSMILQALVILSVSADGLWDRFRRKR
jgi:ABC-type uncharacterized transport system permease subunit